nr:sodefrin precursor-like factor beta 4 [Eurycea tynerensis]
MATLLAVVGFLAAIITKANSLDCEQCKRQGPEASCTGPVVACPEGTTKCIQGLENDTLHGEVVLTAYKTCFVPSIPEIVCTETDHQYRSAAYVVRYNTHCSSDNSPLEVPPLNNTLNGYKCPDCFSDKSSTEECKSDKEIECTGREMECFEYRGIVQRTEKEIIHISLKGCVTTDAWHLSKFLPGTKIKQSTLIISKAKPV